MKGIRISKKPPGPKARKIVDKMKKYCVKSTFVYPMAVVDGEGCFLRDADNNWYLDFTSFVCSAPLGYRHPDVMAAVNQYCNRGAHKIAGQDFYSPEHAALAGKLVEITPKPLNRIFLSNSGAEAVENAIKFAYRKLGPKTGVSCYGAFHGRTLGALTFTCSKPVQKRNYPQLSHRRIKFCTSDDDPAIDNVFKAVRKDTAFVLSEVIQGEGGYNFGSKKFVRNLARAAKQAGVPLIIDEIQAGMGRTGKWWAFEHYDVVPDIMTSAKALQVGATISSKKYDPNESGSVSSTWGGGDRVDMAASLAIIETIQKKRILLNVQKVGKYFLKQLKEITEEYDEVPAVEGLGLMLKLKFCRKKERDRVIQDSFRNGLLLLPCGETDIRIIPPLNIDTRTADLGLRVLEKTIRG